MQKMLFLSVASLVFAALTLAQSIQRQAVIREEGNRYQGKCTLEVYIDDSAEVQIQGANATLRTTSGQPAQWRRFECNAPMPVNPANFRFSGVDGRGRQSLIRAPRNGGPAVVQIKDGDGGAEGYTFDLTWERTDQDAFQLQGPGSQDPGHYREYSDERYRPDYRESDYYRRYGHGFAIDDAIEVGRQEIMRQATRRFRYWGAWTFIGAHVESGITFPVPSIFRTGECGPRRLSCNRFDIRRGTAGTTQRVTRGG